MTEPNSAAQNQPGKFAPLKRGRKPKYATMEEKLVAKREFNRKYYAANKERIDQQAKECYYRNRAVYAKKSMERYWAKKALKQQQVGVE